MDTPLRVSNINIGKYVLLKGVSINYGRGDKKAWVVTKFHYTFIGGITKFQITKFHTPL